MNDGKGPMDQLTAHLDRGWDLITRGDFAAALVSARKGVEVDGDSPEAHNLLGFVLAAEGQTEEALDHYRQAIELDETFVEAMLNAAEVLIHPMRDYGGALLLLDDALDLIEDGEEQVDAMLLKVDVLLSSGDREGAARLVATLPEGPYENPSLDFLIGRARFEVGDVEGAAKSIHEAATQNPEDPEAHYYLGLVSEARGDTRSATVAFLRARELDLAAGPPPWALPTAHFEKHVEGAVGRLPAALGAVLDGALIVVSDVPGAEVVAEGVDPRVPLLLEELRAEADEMRAGRVFVYQRNIDRAVQEPHLLEDELLRLFSEELAALIEAGAGAAAPEPAERR